MSAEVITRWWRNTPETAPNQNTVVSMPLRTLTQLEQDAIKADAVRNQIAMRATEEAQQYETAIREIFDEAQKLKALHADTTSAIRQSYSDACARLAHVQNQIAERIKDVGVVGTVAPHYPLEEPRFELRIEIIERKP